METPEWTRMWATMNSGRYNAASVALANGTWLVTGGADGPNFETVPIRSYCIYIFVHSLHARYSFSNRRRNITPKESLLPVLTCQARNGFTYLILHLYDSATKPHSLRVPSRPLPGPPELQPRVLGRRQSWEHGATLERRHRRLERSDARQHRGAPRQTGMWTH